MVGFCGGIVFIGWVYLWSLKLHASWIVNVQCSALTSLAFITALSVEFITLFPNLNKILDNPC